MASRNFSIDDAFESEEDEPIRVYGSTTESIPLRGKRPRPTGAAVLQLPTDKDATEHSSQSLLQSSSTVASKLRSGSVHSMSSAFSANSDVSTKTFPAEKWWQHPKVRENWKIVLASFFLMLVGLALIITGIAIEAGKRTDIQSYVFFIAGFLCLIPGAYHIVFMYCAVKGKRGFSFYQLPVLK